MTDFLAAALWYAKNRKPIFPLYGIVDGRCTCGAADCGRNSGKHPATANGFKDATTDEQTIRGWWKKNAAYNIGMPTGAASGVTVLDIDPRNGGDQSLEDLTEKHGRIEDTAEQISGGGGRHIAVRHIPGVRKKDIAPGIDIKSDGGYIVVAPSVHLSGRSYQWDGIAGPKALLNPAAAPAWLVQLLTSANGNGHHGAPPIGEKIPHGTQHNTLMSLAGTLRRRGLGKDEICTLLWEVNQRRCEKPAPKKNIRKIAEDVCKYPAGQLNAARRFPPPLDEEHATSAAIVQSARTIAVSKYPTPIEDIAFRGIAGRFVRMVEPHTEADRNWLLILFLVYAGNAFGRRAFIWAGGDRHFPNLFAVAVGPTSTGRKGSATGPVEQYFMGIDDEWVRASQSGLSSGEGLIWCVRDPIYKREKVKGEKGKAAKYEDVLVDPGVDDKRLLVRQPEFFSVLQVMRRMGNTLSPTVRDAWDRGSLNSITKNSPAKATNAHISIVGNITRDELLRGMLSTEADNGFANRFLWACSERSKELPEGGRLWEVIESTEWRELQRDFNPIHYKVEGQVGRNAEACDLWGYDDQPGGAYRHLTRERHGMFGACTARAAPIVLRLSLIYALLDGCSEIRREHLEAALEVWRYCEESAKYIFGTALGEPTADDILVALKASESGLTRSEINGIFGRNRSGAEIGRALQSLLTAKLARFEKEPTNGRPTERWFAVEGEAMA